jgi:hypothetical protein
MSSYKISFILLPLLCLLALFQNCADKSFSESTARPPSAVEDIKSIDNVVIDNEVIEEVKSSCESARRTGKLMQSKQQIVFADTRIESGRAEICEFSQNGNLGTKNTVMQARYEQRQKLQLPSNAVVCDLDMTTDLQRFQYDDVFIFNYNNFILATNNKTALMDTTPPEGKLSLDAGTEVLVYKYDWLKLRGAGFDNVADDFCLGDDQNLATCSWPITERSGNIIFSFDQRILIALGLTARSDNQTFSFVITGDDDPEKDCYHEELSFEMKATYYVK